jgi:hypothetical protein
MLSPLRIRVIKKLAKCGMQPAENKKGRNGDWRIYRKNWNGNRKERSWKEERNPWNLCRSRQDLVFPGERTVLLQEVQEVQET